MADLFISYARADRSRVAPLVAALEAEGWSVWWDPEISPGQEFDRLITAELEAARAVIVVWTPTSVESRWVRGEAREGVDRGVLAPVRFDNAHLPIDMRAIHATDLDGWNDDPGGPQFRHLVRALHTLLGESDGRPHLFPAGRPMVSAASPSARRLWPWRWIAAGVGVAAVAAAVFGYWCLGQAAPGPISIAVDRVSAPASDNAALEFADRLPGDLATMAAARPSSLKIVQPAAGDPAPPAALVVGGQARSVGDTITATMNVAFSRDHAIVWSANFSRPLAQAADLPDQAATRLADVLTCALHGGEPASGDIEVLRLLLTACATINAPDGTPERARDQFRKVVARAPNLARAWGELAMMDALLVLNNMDSRERVAEYSRVVDHDATQALHLDPHEARAWTARAIATMGLANWPRRRVYLEKALALDPDQAEALNDLNDALADIGRLQDSLAAEQRAADGDPLSAETVAGLGFAQVLAGRPDGAKATFDAAERRWPNDPNVTVLHTSFDARMGDAAAALKALNDPTRPSGLDPVALQIMRLLCQARLDPARSADAAAYMRTHADIEHYTLAIQGLAGVGHVDDAFDLIEAHLEVYKDFKDPTEVFFRPFMAKFLASPRFMPLAARIGLVDIWMKTGLWPDYCTAPGAPYDCKSEAAKAMAAIAKRT